MLPDVISGILIFLFFTAPVFSQVPEKMSYQAVLRDGSNQLLSNTQVGMQISILQGSATGTSVYVETHAATTNSNGLITIEIGTGTVISGDISALDWAAGPNFLKTETDPAGGSDYTLTGTSQLLSVPYALQAKTAGNVFSGNYNDLSNRPDLSGYLTTENDPVFNTSVAGGISASDTTNWNNKSNFDGNYNSLTNAPDNVSAFTNDAGYLTSEADGDPANEIQILSISHDTIYLSDGGFVKLPPDNDFTKSGHFVTTMDSVEIGRASCRERV